MTLVWLQDLRLNADLSGPQDAPPMVFVHGLGLDLRVWEATLPSLGRHRILRVDLRGHGSSDSPQPPYAMGTLIRDVERLMDHFALREAVVVGQGEGGLVVQGLAVKRLDLVRAMVLTGSATRFANPSVWEARLARLKANGPGFDAECALLLGPRWRATAVLANVREMLAQTRDEGWLGVAAATATADFYQTTATLTLPTMVLAGADDRKVPPDLQRELVDLVPGADLRLLPGAGHLAMLTHPDSFSEVLTGFLTRLGHR